MNNGRSRGERKLSQWVLYHDAWIELSELFESYGNTIEGAHHDAARCIQQQLEEGTLRSRTLATHDFVLRFDAPTLGREWRTDEAGEIPREFWTHYFETRRNVHDDFNRGISHPLGEGDEADCGHSTFWFVSRQGWQEGGFLEGYVSDVVLFRPDIAQLGKRKGERGKARKDTRGFRSAVARIEARVDAEETVADMLKARTDGIKHEKFNVAANDTSNDRENAAKHIRKLLAADG